MTSSKLQLGQNLQQRNTLMERRKALEQTVDGSRNDLEDWKARLQPLVAKQSAAQMAHTDAQKKRNAVLEQARSKVI